MQTPNDETSDFSYLASYLTEDTHPILALASMLSQAGQIWGHTDLLYSLIMDNETIANTKIQYLGKEENLRDILSTMRSQNTKLRELIVVVTQYKSRYLEKHPDWDKSTPL